MPDDIYVLVPWAERRTLDTCLDAFLTTPAAIHIGADPLLDRFTDTDLCRVGEMTSIQVARRPLSAIEVAQKRAFDLAGAVLLLVLLSPLLAAIAIAIRLDSSGPAIFRQRRYGFNQNPFRIFKFRTMHTMDDGPVVRQATRDDARVTRIGRFLRRWNLDELPQLLNVLMGDMSLVGPRPHAVSHDDEYGRKLSLYARRHNVRPGITGWAQVHGLRGITDTDDKMSKRLAHDLYYIDNWSLLLDVQILIRTLVSAKSYRNAH
jgi:exopolysaccharide biosynthesis polyprenyl glycosylphosphotransferase